MEKWVVAAKRADFDEIARTFDIDPVTARLLRNRDIVGDKAIEAYLHPDLSNLNSPLMLKGALDAARLLYEKIGQGKKIRIIGDYDIDGVCASTILLRTLNALGAVCDCRIPERIKDGYGINIWLIEEAWNDDVDTILTCDNGISASSQIRYARSLGMTVIVTDHHEPLYEEQGGIKNWLLPPANVLVDPKLPDDMSPFKDICGAVVAWKVMMLLSLIAKGVDPSSFTGRWHEQTDEESLCLAGFATVGDVMDLREENRIIVKHALEAMERTQMCGLKALKSVCGLQDKRLFAWHIGFNLGPCINAGGRLETAYDALKLFSCTDMGEAMELASRLKVLNEERKALTEQNVRLAMNYVEQMNASMRKVLVVYLPDCHESIAGIVAGRVRERTNHPVFVITKSSEEGMLKGSGRSTPEYSMFEHLVEVSDLLAKFGGHPMAAGLSLTAENLESFARKINEKCGLTDEDFVPKIVIDVPMPINYINEQRIREISLLEPFGKGNERPLFAQRDLEILSCMRVGASHKMLKMNVRDETGCTVEALYFGDGQELLDYLAMRDGQEKVNDMLSGRRTGMRISVIYSPQINEFRGVKTVQIKIEHYR